MRPYLVVAAAALVDLAAAHADVVDVLPQLLLLAGIGLVSATVGLLALRNRVLS